jgi:hypothetical protein
MKRRLRNSRWFVASLALAGIVCSAIAGFAKAEPAVSDGQVSTESTGGADESMTNPGEIVTDTPEPTADTDQPIASAPEKTNPSIALKGQVWRTKPGIVFLKTPIGLLSLSSKTTLKDLLASQEISFWIHDSHLAIDIRKRSDNSLVHRYLGGPFKHHERDETKLLRWTPGGEQSFDFGAHTRSLGALKEGAPITVEVDEAGTVIGIHDVQFDLQIGQVPTNGSSAHLLLTGTVAKMKSNFIFLRTPIGVVNINTKIGINNAKVGQALTIHIHDRNVEVDLATPN